MLLASTLSVRCLERMHENDYFGNIREGNKRSWCLHVSSSHLYHFQEFATKSPRVTFLCFSAYIFHRLCTSFSRASMIIKARRRAKQVFYLLQKSMNIQVIWGNFLTRLERPLSWPSNNMSQEHCSCLFISKQVEGRPRSSKLMSAVSL